MTRKMLKENFYHELQTEVQTACGWPVIGCAILFHMAGKKFPKYFIRRDQRAVCCASRAVRRPVTPSTPPVPLRKTARSSRAAMDWPHQQRASVCGSAAALRSAFVPAVSPSPLHFLRSPTADRSLVGQFCELYLTLKIIELMGEADLILMAEANEVVLLSLHQPDRHDR